MTALQKTWICEECLEILGPVVNEYTVCNCHDQDYCIAWSRIDMAQDDMDQAAEYNKKMLRIRCATADQRIERA
jgi:hypothetical protein